MSTETIFESQQRKGPLRVLCAHVSIEYLLNHLGRQVTSTKSEGLSLSLHVDIDVVTLDGTTTILTTVFSHTLNGNLGTKGEIGRTGERSIFLNFQTRRSDTV